MDSRLDGQPASGTPSLDEQENDVVAYLQRRSAPCPRCGYELHGLTEPKCPECGEPLILRVGSPRANFGWLVLAMAPGCFSGVAASLLAFPVYRSIGLPAGRGVPTPLMIADVFGFASAASVLLMYRKRHRILAMASSRQAAFATGVWAAHILAFALLLGTMWFFFGRGSGPASTPSTPASGATTAP